MNLLKFQREMLQSLEADASTLLSRLKTSAVMVDVWWQKSPSRWPCAMSHS
jgi:hypothetical protein